MLSSPIQIIKKSVKFFFEKRNMVNLVKVYLPLLPFSVFSIWQNNYVQSYDQLKNSGFLMIVVLINLAHLFTYLLTFIAGVVVIKKITINESINLKEIYRVSWKKLWKFSLLALFISLIQLGGGIMLIIPGIIFSVWYSFSKFIYIEGEDRILNALGRSRNLTRGRFWAIIGREFVFVIFTTIVGILFAIIPFEIGGVFITIFGAIFVLPFYFLYQELE